MPLRLLSQNQGLPQRFVHAATGKSAPQAGAVLPSPEDITQITGPLKCGPVSRIFKEGAGAPSAPKQV